MPSDSPADASSSSSNSSEECTLCSMFPSVHASVLTALRQEHGLPAAVDVLLYSSGHDDAQTQIMQDERLARQLQAELRAGAASTSGLEPVLLREAPGEDAWESIKAVFADAAQSAAGGLTRLTSNLSSLHSWLLADEEEDEDACSESSGTVDECGCPFLLPPPLQGVVAPLENKKDK